MTSEGSKGGPPEGSGTDKAPPDGRGAAARGLGWVILESGGVSLLSLLTLLVLARLIGPAEFGMAGLALSIVQLLYLMAEMLFHDAVVQRRELTDAHKDTAIWAGLALGAVLAGACWAAAPWAERIFQAPGLAPVLAWIGTSLVFAGANGPMTALLRRDMNYRRVAARSVLGRLVGAIVGLAMAVGGFGVWALVAQQVVASGAATVALWVAPPHLPRRPPSFGPLRDLLAFGLPAFLSGLLFQANLRLFVLIAGYLAGPVAAGYLTVALRVVDTARTILGSAAQQLALPLFSRRQDDPAGLARGFRLGTELTAIATLPLFAGLAALAPEVVRVGLGASWEPAVPLVRLLCVVALAQLIRQCATPVLLAVGAPRLLALENGVTFLVSVALLLLAGPYGLVAMTAVWAIRAVLFVPIGVWIVRRAAGVSWSDQLAPVAGPLTASALMAGVVVVLSEAMLSEWGDLGTAMVLVPTGALVYGVALFILCRPAAERFLGFAMMAIERHLPRRTAA